MLILRKTLETKLKEQEQLFEAKLLTIQQESEMHLDSLLELNIKYEKSLREVSELQLQLNADESTDLTFPKKKFHINKAVTLLTTELSDKALATFLHVFVEELGNSKPSHLTTLNQYVLRTLTKEKK